MTSLPLTPICEANSLEVIAGSQVQDVRYWLFSPNGRKIAFLSTGSYARAEVFLDLYLADAVTGKREKKLTKSTLNAEFEELRSAYSQSAFSPG